MAIRYACQHVDERRVRCRTLLDRPGLCEEHQNGLQQVSQPDIVRIFFSLPQRSWERRLRDAGVPTGRAGDRREQARGIEEHAQQFGREARPYRSDFPDSGTLVLCSFEEGVPEKESLKVGLRGVFLGEAFRELLGQYSLGQISIQPRRGRSPRLTIPFYREIKDPSVVGGVSLEAIEHILGQLALSWNVHVYVNPPRGQGGRVTHTINAHGRKEKPQLALLFDHGLWGAAQITP